MSKKLHKRAMVLLAYMHVNERKITALERKIEIEDKKNDFMSFIWHSKEEIMRKIDELIEKNEWAKSHYNWICKELMIK